MENCTTLAPAGTGSTTMALMMSAMLENRTGWSGFDYMSPAAGSFEDYLPVMRNFTTKATRHTNATVTWTVPFQYAPFAVSHQHGFSIETIERSRLRPTRCFVMSVRDPLERLLSGFRYEEQTAFTGGRPLLCRATFFNAPNLIAMAKRGNRQALGFIALSRNKKHVGDDGSFFLKRYDGYLKGANCSRHEVHFLCTRTMNVGWAKLVRTFGLMPLNTSATHVNNRSGTQTKRTPYVDYRYAEYKRKGLLYSNATTVSAEDAAWVRAHMLADDMDFYRRACAPEAERRTTPPAQGRVKRPQHNVHG